MKRVQLKFQALILLLIGFSLAGVTLPSQVSSQAKINVQTTEYTVLSSSVFILGGAYSGNTEKKPFTTYFEYKRNNGNLDIGAEETIPIVRQKDRNGGESGDFYISPSFQLASTYYFRAVGYFNDKPNEKFYGNTSSFVTGAPFIASIPFTVEFDEEGGYETKPYVPESCAEGEIYDPRTDTCLTPLSCTSPEIYSPLTHTCIVPVSCDESKESYSLLTNSCVPKVICAAGERYSVLTNSCIKPVSCTNGLSYSWLTDSCINTSGVTFNFSNVTSTSVTLSATSSKVGQQYMMEIYELGKTTNLYKLGTMPANSSLELSFSGLTPNTDYSADVFEYDSTRPPTCTLPSGGTASGYSPRQCEETRGRWNGNQESVATLYFLTLPTQIVPSTSSPTSTPSSSPTSTGSSKNLIPCGTKTPGSDHQCGFKDIIVLFNNVIEFIFLYLAVPIAAVMFAYAGITLLASGGSPEARGKAKTIFTHTALGLVIAAAAFLIIRTILSIVGYTEISTWF